MTINVKKTVRRIARAAKFGVAVCVPIAGCAANIGDDGVEVARAALVSSQSSNLLPLAGGVTFTALLTTGDSVNDKPDGTPYRMAGIPDGLGAFDNRDGTFTVLMNHELTNTVGIPRAHGTKGAFVSKWVIDKDSLDVLSGEDLMQSVRSYDKLAGTWSAPTMGVVFSRFCSADLPAPSALYDAEARKGFHGRIFFNGEESGIEGRAMAHIVTGDEAGVSYELPHMGRMSFENVVVNPRADKRTRVALTDDGTGGQVYLYSGEKTRSGSPVDRAGLTNGTLLGVKVDGVAVESDATVITPGQRFSMVSLGNVAAMTGAQLETASVAAGVTTFQRPEDSAWNPKRPRELYFVTTASFTNKTRLWRLSFDSNFAGGVIELLVDGGLPRMFDNLAVSDDGRTVIIQEDPGNQDHLAAMWRYEIKSGVLDKIGEHDPARFGVPAGPAFITRDEESSGVIDVSEILGKGSYLLDDQVHASANDAELVEQGQLLLMQIGARHKDKGDDKDKDQHGDEGQREHD